MKDVLLTLQFAKVYIVFFVVRLPEFQGEHTLPVIQHLPGNKWFPEPL